MALDSSPTRVQAPARAGVGLRFQFLIRKARRPPPSWPSDWWQRNYDDVFEMNAPDPIPLTPRQMHLPDPPVPT
jgi:hypothetical protein